MRPAAPGPDAAQAACLATRPGKTTGVREETLRDRWAARARAVGCDHRRLVGKVLGNRRPPPLPPVDQLSNYLLGPAGLTAQATGFDRRDLLQAICQALPAGTVIDRAALQALADRVLASRDVVRLVAPPEDGPRWTTTELLRVEQTALGLARDLISLPGREVAPDAPAAAMPGRTLSGEQRSMVERLAAADGLAVVVGPAGAGKTAALDAAAHVWAGQGRAGHRRRGRGGHRPPPRARHRHRVHLADPAAPPAPADRPGHRPVGRAAPRWGAGGR